MQKAHRYPHAHSPTHLVRQRIENINAVQRVEHFLDQVLVHVQLDLRVEAKLDVLLLLGDAAGGPHLGVVVKVIVPATVT